MSFDLLAYAYGHGPVLAVICIIACLLVIYVGVMVCGNSQTGQEQDDVNYLKGE